MRIAALLGLFGAISAASILVSAARAGIEPVSPDFARAGDEAAGILASYIQIDTTNPPGNERRGAEHLAGVLRGNGIEASLFDTAPGRACVYARLKGTGAKRPVILLNHIDVVPARAEDWRHAPFSGEVHDGELWGRGALDMKGMGVAELEAMLLLKRSGKELDRDVIFLATPDEEVGGTAGANIFIDRHQDLIGDAEYLINEGFHIDRGGDGKPECWGVDVSEKSVLWLKVAARGPAGHASMPIENAATNELVRALDRIVNAPPEPHVLPAVREYFREVSKTQSGPRQAAYADIDAAVKDPGMLRELMQDKLRSSMLLNTISLTVLQGGYKTNVIPAEASAELDCRLLPGVRKEDFVSHVEKLAGSPAVKVSVLDWLTTDASPYDTDLFKAIKTVAAQETPGVPVVPLVVPWFTDSHWFRALGITCYGFEPFEIDPEHLATLHGKDERIPLVELTKGIRRLYRVLDLLCSHAS